MFCYWLINCNLYRGYQYILLTKKSKTFWGFDLLPEWHRYITWFSFPNIDINLFIFHSLGLTVTLRAKSYVTYW